MILKRLVLTVPLLLLVGTGSAAEALTAPYSLTATALSTSQIRLSWNGTIQGAVSYSVERSLSSTSGFVQIGNAGRSTSYTSAGLAPGTRYYYRVRALKNGSTSLYSNVAGATTFGVVTTTTFTTTTIPASTTSTTLATSAPVANAGPDQFTQTLTTVAFNGSGSFDSGGTITSYAWTFGDGVGASGMSVSHAYAGPGTYSAMLTVTDSRGMKASDTAIVHVANRPPVANAGADQSANVGVAVTFSGSASDADGVVTSYAWSFGDGASASGPTATHAFATAGTYTATLTVMDNGGAQATDSAVVTVTGSGGASATWVRRFGTAAAEISDGVAIDGNGNVVMTGRVEGATDFGGGVVCPAASIFVAKYSPAGAPLWCRCLGQIFVGGGEGRSVAVDAVGNVAVTGRFSGTVDFGAGPVTSIGPSDIFVAKYTSSGGYLWSRHFGTLNEYYVETGSAVAVDSTGNVIITGDFLGTADFGGGPVVGAAGDNFFVAKYSASGSYLWSKTTLGKGNGVAVDGGGNVVVTGAFDGTADFGTGPVTSPQGWAIFVAKYSAGGAPMWTSTAGGWMSDAGNSVAVDPSGNVVVTGVFGKWVNFGTGWIASVTGTDCFLAKFTAAGAPIWVKNFPTLGPGNDVAVDGSGTIVFTGLFAMPVDFGGGVLQGQMSGDMFLAKYSAAGAHVWSKDLGGLGGITDGSSVAMDGAGNVVASGMFQGTANLGNGPLTSAGGWDIFLLRRGP